MPRSVTCFTVRHRLPLYSNFRTSFLALQERRRWPLASFSAAQPFGRSWGNSGRGADAENPSLLTHFGHRTKVLARQPSGIPACRMAS
jgi:hypothetical protein